MEETSSTINVGLSDYKYLSYIKKAIQETDESLRIKPKMFFKNRDPSYITILYPKVVYYL